MKNKSGPKRRVEALPSGIDSAALDGIDLGEFALAFANNVIALTERDLSRRMNNLIATWEEDPRSGWLSEEINRRVPTEDGELSQSFKPIRRFLEREVAQWGKPSRDSWGVLSEREIAGGLTAMDREQDRGDIYLLFRHLMGRSASEIAEDLQREGNDRGVTRQNVDQRLGEAVARSMRRAYVAFIREATAATTAEIAARQRVSKAEHELSAARDQLAALQRAVKDLLAHGPSSAGGG